MANLRPFLSPEMKSPSAEACAVIARLQDLLSRLLRSEITPETYEAKLASLFIQLRVLRDGSLSRYGASVKRSSLPNLASRSSSLVSFAEDEAWRLSEAVDAFSLAVRKGEEALSKAKADQRESAPWCLAFAEPGRPALLCVSARTASQVMERLDARISLVRGRTRELERARQSLQSDRDAFVKTRAAYEEALAKGGAPRLQACESREPREPRAPREARERERRRPQKPARGEPGRQAGPGRQRDADDSDPFQRGARRDHWQDTGRSWRPDGSDGRRRPRPRYGRGGPNS